MTTTKPLRKIITGVKPTGSSMHLGNLMGAVLPFRTHAQDTDAAIFIADLHSLTSVKNGDTLRAQSFELAVEYFAIFGIDTPIHIFRQSDIHDITKLMWVLSNVTPYSLMLRAHSFKDAVNKLFEERYVGTIFGTHEYSKEEVEELDRSIEERTPKINMGVFNYPILMSADILGYDIDGVPVGKDQIQHLEMARDIARNFNKTYGQDVFKEPEAIITKSVETLPGIDGRKMSKSYDNFIGVFDDEKTLKKRVMSVVTGSEGVDEKKKNPDECNVFNLYRVFASADEIEIMRTKYNSENIGFGYGHAKTMLLDVLTRYLSPYREARLRLLENPSLVEEKLAEGAKVMNARMEEKMKVVRECTGTN